MQITRETTAANLIRAYEPGRVRVGERWLPGNVIVSADRLIENWTTTEPAALTVADSSMRSHWIRRSCCSVPAARCCCRTST